VVQVVGGGSLAADSVRRLRDTLSMLYAAPDARQSLQDVCDAISELLDCRLVVLCLAESDGMEVVAHSGDEDGESILGNRSDLDDWHRMLDESIKWGELRFCRDPRTYIGKQVDESHDDELQLYGDDERWGSLNILVAPLWSPEADLVGAIALDCAAGERLPDELMRTILELFTAQAAVAIHQQRLADSAAADHLALRLSEERYRLSFDNAPIGMAELASTSDGVIVARVNRAASRMLGVSTFWARDKHVDEVFAVVEGESLGDQMAQLLEEDRHELRVEALLRRPDGSKFWGLVQAAPLPDIAGRASILCQVLDISEARASTEALEVQARHDPLTGLPNRSVVLNRLDDVVESAASQGVTGALLFCDLDGFKAINDEQGHLVGDEVLSELSIRLDGVVRKEDTVGRFGGDEFVVVAYPLGLSAAKALADRISDTLSQPIVVDGGVLRVQVSIGIAVITGSVEASEVLRRADSAMYAVRSRRHRPTFVVDTA
jgi:diguanylate cyclase (GGDEF)-like protein/PAS domain S-box-containing protein